MERADISPEHPPNISGYTILETLYISKRTSVYRAIRNVDQLPVVLKMMRQLYPSFSQLVQFRNQYTITKNLNSPKIIRSLSLESYHHGYILVMEDLGSISLVQYTQQHPLTWLEVLKIAKELTEILDHIHQNHIIHKDIKPANILIHPQTKQIHLIDFHIASLLPKETQEIQNPNVLEGTLAYLAPEQTGRMNRGIDYRADFYSLGVTLYELLTGQLPFLSEDPLELVHCHLAKNPPPLWTINPEIPPIVSQIVMKLMAKNAEHRYQSSRGINYDLEICLQAGKNAGQIQTFTLGKQDISERFLIPEKLYGRQLEINSLLQTFDRVVSASGASEMMLVAGFSGIGKTAVINEIHKPITRQKGYFIKGKFDQFNRNIPLSAFVQTFRDLISQLLAESELELSQWRKKICTALGENAQVLIEIIPELEKIIGKQPPIVELSGNSAQNRFNLLFQKFIEVFTKKEHPLVIFLDDLQWVDSASLQLIKILMEEKSYLLLLGAYRDNEVSPVHPFILTCNELKKTGKIIHVITLNPLTFADINQWVSETLHCSLGQGQPLSKLIENKTQGNPFFITQFLKALYEDKQITFNLNKGYWEYDLLRINLHSLTDDVVQFMAQQLHKLPPETKKVLKLAACIGNQFDLETLAIISETSEIDTANYLWKALQEVLIIPQNKVYKFYVNHEPIEIKKNKIEVTYRFSHDRIQQAAYSLIPDHEKQITHYRIGQLLLDKISPENREERIFELVSQLNHGISFISQQNEQYQLAELNLIACRKARISTAYQVGREYANMGLQLLGKKGWKRQYKMSLAFHELATELAVLNGDFLGINKLVKTVIKNTTCLFDRINIYRILIQANVTQKQLAEAITIGRNVLQELGITFPEHPTPNDIQQSITEIQQLIGNQEIEAFVNLPLMTDQEKIAIVEIANSIMPAAYFFGSPLLPLLVTLSVKLSLLFGNTLASAYAYAVYGFITCHLQHDVETGVKFGHLALGLIAQPYAKTVRSEVLSLVGLFIAPRKSHIKQILSLSTEGYKAGLEVGNLEYVGYNAHNFCIQSFWCGQPLVHLESEIKAYSQELINLNQLIAANWCQINWQLILNLQGMVETPYLLSGEVIQESELLPTLLSGYDLLGLCLFYLYKAFLCYLFNQIELAQNYAFEVNKYLKAAAGFVVEPVFYFYDALINLASLNSSSSSSPETSKIFEKIDERWKELQENWARYAPMNYQHKVNLISAEKYRILGDKLAAIEQYEQAILGAKENGYLQDEALANELAGKFYLDWGKDKVAATYIQEAYYAYARWGAESKVKNLEEHYPQLLSVILQGNQVLISSGMTINPTIMKGITHSNSNQNLWLDFPAIMKAIQAISQEINLDKLLTTLMKIVLQNAGAQRGYLLLYQDEQWLIIVQGETEEINILNIPLDSFSNLPKSLIKQVIETQETAVFDNLSQQFSSDPYIITYKPQSVLSTAISHQGKLIGILYLENNLSEGVFTQDRVEVLQLLIGQAAISLENAYLYQQTENHSQILEIEVERKTKALQQKAEDLEQTLKSLQQAQAQLIQTEKMSSLGQLVAGIAHEINNPINFIQGNIAPTQSYIKDLIDLLRLYEEEYPQPSLDIQAMREEIEVDFLLEDMQKILESIDVGSTRISNIVESLKNFSRLDESEIKRVDIHLGIESTLLILQHRFKESLENREIQVIKEYGDTVFVECYPSALNQVFMNILTNAIDALQEVNWNDSLINKIPTIKIKTFIKEQKYFVISISDNGLGIPENIRERIFDPFFTTKEVGKGTGLGLSISYQIIVEKHQGNLFCCSLPNSGVEFRIEIPL